LKIRDVFRLRSRLSVRSRYRVAGTMAANGLAGPMIDPSSQLSFHTQTLSVGLGCVQCSSAAAREHLHNSLHISAPPSRDAPTTRPQVFCLPSCLCARKTHPSHAGRSAASLFPWCTVRCCFLVHGRSPLPVAAISPTIPPTDNDDFTTTPTIPPMLRLS
jgi:hypothetical protein